MGKKELGGSHLIQVGALFWDRIKRLKLRRICTYWGGVAVHKRLFSPSCTAAAIYLR